MRKANLTLALCFGFIGFLDDFTKLLLQNPQLLLPKHICILLCHIKTFSGNGINQSFLLQLLICPLGGDYADFQIPRQRADGRKHFFLPNLLCNDSILDLPDNLFVNCKIAGIRN